VSVPLIFDPVARRRHRDRAAARFAEHDFLQRFMGEGLADRLAAVKRSFADALLIGCAPPLPDLPAGIRLTCCDPSTQMAARAGGSIVDEAALPFPAESFDLVLSLGLLDSVNDLPGALLQVRRLLRPDGLFLAAFVGGASLSTLRSVLIEAEGERPAARVHPMIDVRAAGDLLMRAGFALPVADSDMLTVRYRDLFALIADLRGMGAANALAGRSGLRRDALARAATLFADRADGGGRVAERFEIINLTGWAPSPDQPQPARRGSATASLAAALESAKRL